jgi:thiazole synthase
MVRILIDEIDLPIIVDAGIGKPSEAAEAMEMGAAAVLVNTAIAVAGDPAAMAGAFSLAVKAGRQGFLAGLGEARPYAEASSPLTGFLRDRD